MSQPTEPNHWVHADLFGSLKKSSRCKKYILCITNAFTKYVQLVTLATKEVAAISKPTYKLWICQFSAPINLKTDQAKEFCARTAEQLFKNLGIKPSPTTAGNPQTNSQAKITNNTIAKSLAS
jgi:transposase InsO family protein